ncbi:MAG: hypothetical protein QGI21_01990 [Candidatus Poseidoniaceae archaeon]|jgi:hypothetical protein|nr:hypothetical protein [Candidatus Poseidoniaceae archaeon]
MPGSPYLENPPQGLLTWPKLLIISIPTIAAITVVAWWKGLLLEWSIFAIISLFGLAILRR